MNGKEAYDKIFDKLTYDQQQELGEQVLRTVYQDLNRLEKLEKENKVLREKVNHFKNVKNRYRRNEKFVEKENAKLKKVIKILDREFIFKTTDVTNVVWIGCEYSKGKLTKEEYELLKEALNNE